MPLPPSLARSARVSECQAPGRGEYSLHLTQQGTPRMGQLPGRGNRMVPSIGTRTSGGT